MPTRSGQGCGCPRGAAVPGAARTAAHERPAGRGPARPRVGVCSLGRDGTTVRRRERRPVRGGGRGAAGPAGAAGGAAAAVRLDDIVGQDELVGPGRPLRVLVESDRLSSVIFWGPPGTGKTTLAQVIARHTAKAYEQLSAVSASVKDVREVVARAEQRLGERGQGTILFLDEVHRFNKAQQDALLPVGRERAAGAGRRHHREPVLRGQRPADVAGRRCSGSSPSTRTPSPPCCARASTPRAPTADAEALAHLAERAGGDGRHALTSLEVAVALARARRARTPRRRGSRAEDAEAALGTKLHRYGRDDHYDVDLGLHQEHPGLRPPGRPALAGPHARGGGGRPLHRPPAGDPRQRGRGRGRPAGPGRGHRRRPRRRVRRPARGPAQPGPGGRPPGHGAQVEPVGARDLAGPRGRRQGRRRRGPGAPARRPLPLGRRRSATAWATSILTTTRGGGCASSTCPTRCADAVYYQPSRHGYEQEIADRMDRLADGTESAAPSTTTGTNARERHRPRGGHRRRVQRRGRGAAGRRRWWRSSARCGPCARSPTLLRTETAPVIDDLRDTVEAANYEIVRLDGLVSTTPSRSPARSTRPRASPTSPWPTR